VVIIDPPFNLGVPIDVVGALANNGFVADEGIAVLRIASRTKEMHGLPFSHSWTRRYGDSTLIYMSAKEASP
jgi:16S rRNA G966 N2-methylase RsmD